MDSNAPLLTPSTTIRKPLTAQDIELYPRSNIVQYHSLPDPWKDYVKHTARIYIEQYNLITTTHINIPYGIGTTLKGFLSSQEVIIEFGPILQEVMHEIITKKDITRSYIIFNTPLLAEQERSHWTIAFVF